MRAPDPGGPPLRPLRGYFPHDRLARHALRTRPRARPAPQDPQDQGRQGRGRRRRPRLRAVDDARRRPPTSTRPCSRSPSSRPPAATSCASPARARTTPRRCRRSPGSRRSRSSPTSTSSRSTSTRRSTPAAPPCASTRATSASSTTRSSEIARRAKDAGVSIRIGVNAGSLDPRLLEKYGKPTAEALVESAVWEASLFEEHDFHDFKISVKHNDPVVMVRAYELLSERGDWPLHLGVTEAGPAFQGTIKSATAFGALLSQGHRRHDPRLAVGAAGRGGQGRQPDPAVAQPAAAQARDRLVPLVRARAGRRLHARRRRSPPASRA